MSISMQEQLASIEMSIEDIDNHLRSVVRGQRNHKPATTEIIDFWLEQRAGVMRKEGYNFDGDDT